MMALTEHKPYTLTQSIQWLVVALLFVTLTIALSPQLPSAEPSTDETLSTTLVLQKKVSDGDGEATAEGVDGDPDAFDVDTHFDAVSAAVIAVPSSLRISASTTRHLAASKLVFIISGSPRAPPRSFT